MSHNKGNNSNDGLSDKAPKSGWGSVSGTGIASVVKNGGTVVSCEKMYLGADYTWNVGGKTLITATYGKDYRNAEPANNPASGVLKFKPNVKFTVASDLTFDNIILHQEATITVASGATLEITDTVTTVPRDNNYITIIVENGGKAIINGGTFKSVEGEGTIQLGTSAKILADAAKNTVAFMSHNNGKATNDGLTDQTPKTGWGSTTGTGVASVLKNGGTLVACEKMYLGANYKWEVEGDTIITAVYGGKDYRNAEPADNPARGVFKLKSDVTLTVGSNVTFDNIILHQDATIMVAPGATLTITDTVTTVPLNGNYLNIIVATGAKAVINGGTYSSIAGNGDITVGEKVTVVENGNDSDEAIERVSGVCFVDNANGNNKNDGKSAATAVKNYGVGVVEKLPVGGTIVVGGKSHIAASGNPAEFSFNTWGKGVTITSVYDGVDYRKENADAAFSIAENTILHIYSDITFDNINLICDGKDCVIYVHSGAMLSVTDAVEFISNADGGKHYTIKLEKGAYAHLSTAAMNAFTVVGDGYVIPYVNGYTDIFTAALGTTTMVQLTIGSTTAYVNGDAQTLDAAPINRNNRTMLPVRFLANAFGVDNDGIKWDAATRTATLKNSEVT
ncbi:MAG: copper amine oxidase N-terminal domain-containing protein, partial [Clostridia bacterium]|nr:copper amine oxidase N-terminal domain-containing protein [Clostridia bacterium]